MFMAFMSEWLVMFLLLCDSMTHGTQVENTNNERWETEQSNWEGNWNASFGAHWMHWRQGH